MFKLKLLACMLFLGIAAQAQQKKFTISGTVQEKSSGEILIGAVVKMGNAAGAATNEYGFYSITLPEGAYKLEVGYRGYDVSTTTVSLHQNISRKISMETKD